MDFTTLALVMGLVLGLANVVLAVVLLLLYLLGPKYPGPGWWASGQLVGAAGAALRNFGSESLLGQLVIPVALTMIITGAVLLYVGLLRFFGRRERWWPMAGMLVALLASTAWFTIVVDLMNVRGALFYLCAVIITGASSRAAWLYGKDSLRSSAAVVSFSFLAAAATDAVLLMASAAQGTTLLAVSSSGPTTIAAYIGLLVTSLLWTFGLVMLVNQRLQADLALQANKLQTVFATSPEASAITRLADGTIVDINDGFRHVTGFTRAEALGKSTEDLGIWVNIADRDRMVAELATHGTCQRFDSPMRRKDGTIVIVMITANILDLEGELFAISVSRDVTEQRRMEATLVREATTDELTGLANRRQFFAVADDALRVCSQQGDPLSVAVLDMDGFKGINDTLGHAAGDESLVAFAGALVELLADQGTAGRLGGDEFGLLLPGKDAADAVALVDEIRGHIHRRSLIVGDHERELTISAGVAAVTSTIDDALGQADTALYRAKDAGRNRVEVAADIDGTAAVERVN